MFCPECGNHIEDQSIRFCPECGTKIEEEHHAEKNTPDHSRPKETGIHGVIFTNVELLAEKMGVDRQDLTFILDEFICQKREYGISYKLVDAGNYTYRKSGFWGNSKTVRLKKNSPLWDYMDILMDVHNDEVNTGSAISEYLFIIGSNDIIPMPCIRHYDPDNFSDDSIDTDILYAYPYGKEMITLLENQEAFKYEQLFFVGRLPFGEDASREDLYDYLERDVYYSNGIPMGEAYGQCDPNWKMVSYRITKDLSRGNYFRNLDQYLSADCYYNRLILSPMIIEENINQVFHSNATLYYFNLHGGEAREARGYFGSMLHREKEGCFPVIQPEHLMTCNVPNIIISEACYGGRFIGLDQYHSMLLASLFTNTLAFVGSSRIALGAFDSTSTSSSDIPMSYADIIANYFINAILQGYSAAEALFYARSNLLQASTPGDPHVALTIVEFNLFGDPTISMNADTSLKSHCKTVNKTALVAQDTPTGCTVEKIETGNRGSSILEQVRSAVNANIHQIHTTIDQYLYANYGIQPRPVDQILKIKYNNGQEELKFNYDLTNERKTPTRVIVTTSPEGKIKSVYSTK